MQKNGMSYVIYGASGGGNVPADYGAVCRGGKRAEAQWLSASV